MKIIATANGYRRDYSYVRPMTLKACKRCGGQFYTLRDGLCIGGRTWADKGCYLTVTSEG